MKKEDKKKYSEVMEGYNPRIYRRLSWLFGTLTILNLVVIVYAFAITGYGLWHAEDALSYIAKVSSSFEEIDQTILKVVIHEEDQDHVSNSINRIEASHQEITDYAQKFRQINLNNIDRTIPGEFDEAMEKIELYCSTIMTRLKDVESGNEKADILLTTEMETLQEDAGTTIKKLFEKQDEATYIFFCKIGQRFLLVPSFLILTMSAGLFTISKSKKRDYEYAVDLQSSKRKTEKVRKKAQELVYTNVLTGMKNRYALSARMKERMVTEDVTVVLFSYNKFKNINEYYGREFADEFILAVSQKILAKYGEQAEFFSTETDEICVMFNKEVPKSETILLANRISDTLSKPIQIRGAVLQHNVAGCICHATVNANASDASVIKLLISMDQMVDQALNASISQNKSVLLKVS